MKTVISVRKIEEIVEAQRFQPDLIEIRTDLIEGTSLCPEHLPGQDNIPIIVTCRSRTEGGRFTGTPAEWFERVEPWLSHARAIDLERNQKDFCSTMKAQGLDIIASCHCPRMLTRDEFSHLEGELRSMGTLPKIVVTPSSVKDVLILIDLTESAPKPICTGIQGKRFRFGRLLLPLAGSELVYCHTGTPVAEGQYHIADFRTLFALLQG